MKICAYVCVSCIAALTAIGCAPVTSVQYNPAYIPKQMPTAYDDGDWAAVLRDTVREGLVDYRKLAQNRQHLDKYLGLISVVGPQSTPNLFRTPSDQICYYINAYNACVLRAVLESYPTPTMHSFNKPRLDYEYVFRLDGARVKLAHIRQKLKAAAQGDARVLFCLSEASLGSPALADQSYRPSPRLEQMRHAVEKTIENPFLLRIEDNSRTAYLWTRLLAEQEWCMDYYHRVVGSTGGDLLSFLRHVAGEASRARLSQIQGYKVLRMPVDRRLNDWTTASGPSTAASQR